MVPGRNGKARLKLLSSLLFACADYVSSCLSGFTAIVNKELSAKYDILVNKAPELITALPWGPDFEVDVFRKPDFTALEIVSFATGGESHNILVVSDPIYLIQILTGIPAGINVCIHHGALKWQLNIQSFCATDSCRIMRFLSFHLRLTRFLELL